MAGKIKGITVEIGGNTVGLTKALGEVNKQSNSLQRELREVDKLLKLDPANTDLLNQRQEILGKTVNTTKEKLEKLKEAERQAQEQFQKGEISEEQYRALQREVIKTEKDLEKFEERLKKTNPKLEEFGAKARETGDKLKDVGGKLTKGVTVPLAAAGAGLVAVGAKFDDVYDNIRIGTGATGEALQELNEDFRQVAKQTPASLDDVGISVADYNTRLGLSGEALQGLSRQTLELVRITGGDLSTTIEETSQSFQAFNLPAEQYGQALDFIFKVSQSTGIGINRLQQNMVKFSPALKQLGLNFEQSATLMGQLDKAGVDVEQTLAGLTKSVATMAKKGIKDANQAIEILFKQIKDAPSDIEGSKAALEIFGNRAGPAMASAIREGKLEYQDLIKELQGSDETILGVADETKDFAERFIELKNNVMLALEPLGEQLFNAINDLVPLFQGLVGFVGKLVERFANLSPATQKIILIVGGIFAALGPLLTLIGTITAALPALAGAFALLTGPVGIVIGIITALIAVGVALYKNWDTIKEACGVAWDWIVEKTMVAVEALKGAFNAVLNFIKNNWQEIVLFITNPIAGAIALLYKLNPKFKEWVDNLITSVKNWFVGMVDAGKELVNGIWEGISGSWTWLLDKIEEWCGSVLTAMKKFFGIESPSKVMRDEVGKYLVEGLAQGISDNSGVAKKAAEDMAEGVKAEIKTLNDYVDTVNAEIKALQDSKEAADKTAKAAIDAQIKAKKDLIDATKKNIEALKGEQKQFEETAKAYKEAAELINKGLTDSKNAISLDRVQSENAYKLWEVTYGRTAAEAERLQEKEASLTEQYDIQAGVVEATEEAYALMVEQYGEAYEGSRELYNQILKEKAAYAELGNSIDDVKNSYAALRRTELDRKKEETDLEYKMWEAVHGDTATEAEKLRKQEESLTDQYNIQKEVIGDTEDAYKKMVEKYGEAHESSREMYRQLQQEKVAYEELYSSILDVRKARGETADNSQAQLRGAQHSYTDYLRDNFKALSSFGLSASDIFDTARKVSGLDKAQDAVKSVTVNQNITTTAATPSEIREAARDGARLATKEAYA